MNINWIFKNIESIINSDIDTFSDSIIYLDPEQLSELYSILSGLKGRPSVEVRKISGEIKASLILGTSVSGDVSKTIEISDTHLLKAILPALRKRYVTLSDCALFKQKIKQRVWLKGKLSYKSSFDLDVNSFGFDNLKSFMPVFKTRVWTKFAFAEGVK